MTVRVEDNLVSGEIRNTPFQDALAELAAWTGIIFEVESQDNEPVFISFFRSPLREAVQRLVGERDSVVYCDLDEAGQPYIQLVKVLSGSQRSPQPSLRYIGTGEATKDIATTVETPEQALVVLAESENVDARQNAVELLTSAETDVAVEALRLALRDPAPEVQAAAIEGLAGLGADDSLPQILQLLGHEHPGVRYSAVMAVALLGNADDVRHLQPLVDDRDASVASAAEMAIRKLAGQRP